MSRYARRKCTPRAAATEPTISRTPSTAPGALPVTRLTTAPIAVAVSITTIPRRAGSDPHLGGLGAGGRCLLARTFPVGLGARLLGWGSRTLRYPTHASV